jgi:hypothetical protein
MTGGFCGAAEAASDLRARKEEKMQKVVPAVGLEPTT